MSATMRKGLFSCATVILALVLVFTTLAGPIAAADPGEVLSWGSNQNGQLGLGFSNEAVAKSAIPVHVVGRSPNPTLGEIREISAGESFSLALGRFDILGWGLNNQGQLGNSTTSNKQSDPVSVRDPSDLTFLGATAISAGGKHGLALRNDGTVWAWGVNFWGQLGIASGIDRRLVASQVAGPGGTGTLNGITSISAGGEHSLALRNDGTAWAWGLNRNGQLGNGSVMFRTSPVQVMDLSGVVAIAAGNAHSLAIKNDGTVWAWGANNTGQLGDGTSTDRLTPVQVLGPGGAGFLNDIVAVSARESDFSLALKRDGTVWAWGANNFGQLGNGTGMASATPVQVAGLSDVTAISAGGRHGLALKNDRTVWAWGDNTSGQLGDGTTANRSTPVQVVGRAGDGVLRAGAIAAGVNHSLAILSTAPPPTQTAPAQARNFPATGFRIDNDAFWDYFNKRGGIRTFGFPVSRTFPFLGSTTQFFQRGIMQLAPDGSVRTMNILDPGLMPFTTINGSTFPGPDPAIIAQAPTPGSPGYDVAVQNFVRSRAPNQFEGLNTNFYQTFVNTVTLGDAFPGGGGNPALLPGLNLEMWGVPTSNPARDPKNNNFVYLRFQRGVMHFDATNNTTQGLLLADFFKSIITGRNLPRDLEDEAKDSIFFKQYNPTKPNWVDRPNELPGTNLTLAFEPQ